jgi:hypothetical protein
VTDSSSGRSIRESEGNESTRTTLQTIRQPSVITESKGLSDTPKLVDDRPEWQKSVEPLDEEGNPVPF